MSRLRNVGGRLEMRAPGRIRIDRLERRQLCDASEADVGAGEGLAESLETVWTAPNAVAALDAWAEHLARYHPRLLALDRSAQRVWRSDPNAAAHRGRVVAAKLTNCRRLARWLADEGRLANTRTTESTGDMLFALISSDMIEALIVDRRWSRRRLADRLAILVRSTVVAVSGERN